MTIPFVQNPGGLFNRLGALGLLAADVRNFQLNTSPPDVTKIFTQYETGSNTEPDLVGNLATAHDALRNGMISITGTLKSEAIATLERMIFRDQPVGSRTNLLTNVNELIRQMSANGQTVKSANIGMSVATVSGTTNAGNGVVVFSTRRGDGLVQENSFAETASLICTVDAQRGAATAGGETWQYRGVESQGNVFHWEFPLGSGALFTLTSVNPQKNNSGGNLLVNGNMETFTSNVPNKFAVLSGTAGTDFVQDTLAARVYSGTSSLRFLGGTPTMAALAQQFASSSLGTPATLKADTQYSFALAARVDVTTSAGQFVVDLIDQNSNIISDDQGVLNSVATNVLSLTQNFSLITGVFRLPKTLPTTVKLRIRISQLIPAGTALNIDHWGFAQMSRLYTGGPSLNVYSGVTPWLQNDRFVVTTTNDRGGRFPTDLRTFQTLADQFYGMRQNELLLPSSSSPTILDSLIG